MSGTPEEAQVLDFSAWGVGLLLVSVCILLGNGIGLSGDFGREYGMLISQRHLQ